MKTVAILLLLLLTAGGAAADEIHAHVHVYDGTRTPRVTLRDRIRGFWNAQPGTVVTQVQPATAPTPMPAPAQTAGNPAALPVAPTPAPTTPKRTLSIEVK